MLDIENVTNIKIEKSNSSKSTSNQRIKKINIEFIQLIHNYISIYFQNKFNIVKIKTNLFQRFKNFATLFFNDIVFFFNVKSNFVFVTYQMFFLISQNHQNLFSIFKTRVYREKYYVDFIIDENKRKRIDKSDFDNIHYFLLSEISDEEIILLQKRINELSDKNEINDENSIKDTNFDKITSVDRILTKNLIQNFNHFCNI